MIFKKGDLIVYDFNIRICKYDYHLYLDSHTSIDPRSKYFNLNYIKYLGMETSGTIYTDIFRIYRRKNIR